VILVIVTRGASRRAKRCGKTPLPARRFDFRPVREMFAIVSPIEGQFMKLASKIRRFLASDDGPTAVEYAVMLGLIVTVCIAAIMAVGTSTKSAFNSAASSWGAGS
jgi:pilus assembly protein Flp/PilA